MGQPASLHHLRSEAAEDGGIGAAEAVDRLLLIANQRDDGAFGETVQQHRLHRVRVLELIHQEGPPALVIVAAHRGLLQRTEGVHFQVAVVKHSRVPLRLLHLLPHLPVETAQDREHGGETLVDRTEFQ